MANRPTGSGGDGDGSHAASRLLANEARIFDIWAQRLRERSGAAVKTDSAILRDALPAILRQLAEALTPGHPRHVATEGSTLAEEHGAERVRVTSFTLGDLVLELSLLRQVLVEVLQEERPLGARELGILDASIDEALVKSSAGYMMVQAEFRDRFLAILAHDLRTPLAVATASAGLILRKPASDQVARWAAKALDALETADTMVHDLLDVAKVESGQRLSLVLEEADFEELVGGVIENMQTRFGDRFVCTVDVPKRGHFAPSPMQRALENLITNAVKYGDAERPIRVSAKLKFGRVLLSVHNEGSYIPAEEQETLFWAFERSLGGKKAAEGWGLGLPQVRGVAEAHGGSVVVDSLPGRGTTFTIDVPLDARPYQDAPAHSPD